MSPINFAQKIAASLSLRSQQVAATIALLDEGNTLPFIARYRKEVTDSMDEDQIRSLTELLERFRTLDERRETILNSIREQGKLTPELEQAILEAETVTALEDLYQPYKPKRRTRASIARDKGLQPLAELIIQQVRGNQSAEQLAAPFLNDDVPDVAEALAGARDIVAETISDDAHVRGQVRERALKYGLLQCGKVEDAEDSKGVYETYYNFDFRVDRIKPYQVLAINRGEAEKGLRVALDVTDRDCR